MGRKSSKRCCIFHKEREFGESSTDSSDYDSDGSLSSSNSGGTGGDNPPKIAYPKIKKKKIAHKKKKIPNYQKYHA